ncbi:MAG: hypothetical protein ACD_50C00112G0003 [uncultured bacterium]|nr:MAG: hypothetical protein ACD_50C00112G0003 [uncultured bacterium]OGH13146.1 MAG: hypothetical protein A2687_05150 [Candidatus Levybacteria bacterium RIFCSPHIGHO2_01_FULL_38_26]
MGKIFVLVVIVALGILAYIQRPIESSREVLSTTQTESVHWLSLHRKSNIEYLYEGVPGRKEQSRLIKTFKVKTGISGQSPTPLPKLLGRNYWLITDKTDSSDNPETAPYFISLDIPVSEEYPYGPIPYDECNGECNWEIPGYFGLHGVNGDMEKLSEQSPGSLGCIRHSNEDITYLFNLLDPKKEEIRYYIEDI